MHTAAPSLRDSSSYYINAQGFNPADSHEIGYSESDLLLSKLSCVFLGDVECVEFLELLLFNSLDLAAFLLDLLADLATLLEVVKAVLLRLLVVGLDLRAQLLRVLL